MTETTVNPKVELAAMQAVSDALAGLDAATAGRVLRWAAEALGVAGARTEPQPAAGASTGGQSFGSLAELHAAASPTTDADQALVAGYWFQFIEGEESFGGQQVNSALKDLGHGVSNITTAFDTLKAQKPALVIQLKKAGTSKQARKTYKLTAAGQRAVEQTIMDQRT